MKRAFSTLCCTSYSANEIIQLAKKSGLAVELRVDDAGLETFGIDPDVFNRANVAVTDIAASVMILGKNIPEKAYRYVDLASKMGAKAVRIFAGENPKTFQDKLISDVEGIIKGIRTLCQYAQEKNVDIWLENHSELSTGKLCKQVLDAVDMPNLKIIWDVLHSLEYKESLDETIAHLGDRIVHIHFKDGIPPEDPTHTHYVQTDLGLGVMPFEAVVAKLSAIGYDGYYSLEWESPWCPQLRDLYPDPAVLLEKYNKILDKCE